MGKRYIIVQSVHRTLVPKKNSSPTTAPAVYKREALEIRGQVSKAIQRDHSRYIYTDRMYGGSLLSDDFCDIYQGNSMSISAFLKTLKTAHADYEPGKPLKVPIVSGTPRGLGIQIEIEKDIFDVSRFELMVDELWDDVSTYSWREAKRRIQAGEDKLGSVKAALDGLKNLLMLAGMKGYGWIFLPGLERSYMVNNEKVGIRFYQTNDSCYIDISGGVTQYERTLNATQKVAEYLDTMHTRR